MKNIFLFILCIFFSVNVSAQLEIPRKSTPIEAIEKPKATVNGSIFIPEDNSSLQLYGKTPRTLDMSKDKKVDFDMRTDNDNNLLTAGDFIKQKWTEDKKVSEEHFGDQYLGDFKTKGKFVEVYCRDYQYVDGDRVRVFVNGKMVQSNIELQANYSPILVSLESGFNTIEFEALNQGASGPNTAALKIFGEEGELIASSEWNLLTGGKASLIVVKQ